MNSPDWTDGPKDGQNRCAGWFLKFQHMEMSFKKKDVQKLMLNIESNTQVEDGKRWWVTHNWCKMMNHKSFILFKKKTNSKRSSFCNQIPHTQKFWKLFWTKKKKATNSEPACYHSQIKPKLSINEWAAKKWSNLVSSSFFITH